MPATRPVTAEFSWNARACRYVRGGRFVSERAVKLSVRRVIRQSTAEIRAVTGELTAGRVTVADWQARMAAELKNLHVSAAMAARGGFRQMTRDDYLRVGRELKFQYARLRGFARDYAAGKLTRKQTEARAGLYVAAMNKTFEGTRRQTAAAAGFTQERNLLGPTEAHCTTGVRPGCVEATAAGWVAIGTLSQIGARQCLANCGCTYQFRRVKAALPPPPARPEYGGAIDFPDGDEAAVVDAARRLGLRVDNARQLAAIGVPTAAVFGRVSIGQRSGVILIEATADGGGVADRVLVQRDGDPVLVNNALTLPEAARGGGAGTRHFAGQVDAARAAGVARIDTYAARGPHYNGYYTWPRLGYDGPLPALSAAAEAERPAAIRGATRLREVMADADGRAWWKRRGESQTLTFDLGPRSKSIRTLRDYMAGQQP